MKKNILVFSNGEKIGDGLIKQDFLREKYEFFLRECDWRMEINSGKSQGTTYPADRLPDTIGNNKMWGFSNKKLRILPE